MKSRHPFFSSVCALALPVALQSMLQSSFSIVDQIMIGRLGSVSIAGVGLAGKFSSIFSVIVSAVGAVAGIMLSQYLGQKNRREIRRSFYLNLLLAAALGAVFTALCVFFPLPLMRLYSSDPATQAAGAEYLAVIAWTFLPMAAATLLSTLLRCADRPKLPLYAGIVSALLNTGVNYILIFGKCGFAPMGARGAAIATVLSQLANALMMLLMLLRRKDVRDMLAPMPQNTHVPFALRQYLSMLIPILVCEVFWSLGENVYAAIYGHMSTDASAAMTLTNPVQGLVIGALCGLSQAAGVIVGKRLGESDHDGAFTVGKRLMLYGLCGSVLLSLFVVLFSPLYVKIYNVEPAVRLLTRQILLAYAVIAPIKVLNMILGGGILRSGGKTTYIMAVDLIGTWVFGVPLGLLGAFVLKLSIPWVYFLLSLEECVRLAISLVIFYRKRWIHTLDAAK